MAEPKHKVKEKKQKGFLHKLKNSAIFILFMIVLAGADLIFFIVWLSSFLSQGFEEADWVSLYIAGGITAFFVLVFGGFWLNKKMEARA